MRGLKVCLWVAGLACLLSVFGVVFPMSCWEKIAGYFGAEPLPDSPLFEYMVRLMSATYVGVGVFFVILARDPARYGVMVPFAGYAAVLLGLTCAATGLVIGMPVLWFLGDSVGSLVLGMLILTFWQKARK
ncbi:DUF4345 family protein [Planctomycetota bacterium]